MGWFDLWREDGRNTYFSSRRSPVLADLTQVLIIILCIIAITSLIVVVIGTRGKTRWSTFLKVLLSLHTGISILVSLFGHNWQVSHIETTCPYSVVERHSMQAYIGVHVGLKWVNITMEGKITTEHGEGDINYNERFNYDHVHDMAKAYHDAQLRGLPQAILYIAEYFTVDGGGLRWQRALRSSGHFAFILLWSSFVAWLVSNLLLLFAIFQGAALMALCGAMMLTAIILYHSLQPAYPLAIPFQDDHIQLSYGWCFWLVAISGTLTFLTGVVILVLRKFFLLQVSTFFLMDSTHLTESEPEPEPRRKHFLSVTPDDSNNDDYFFDERRYSVYSNNAYNWDDGDDEDDENDDNGAKTDTDEETGSSKNCPKSTKCPKANPAKCPGAPSTKCLRAPPRKCSRECPGSKIKDVDLGDTVRSVETLGSISSGGSCLLSTDDETLPRRKPYKLRPSVSFVLENSGEGVTNTALES